MIAAQRRPLRHSRTAKNDRNDAETIATAARQGNTRLMPVKSVEQQVRLGETALMQVDIDPDR